MWTHGDKATIYNPEPGTDSTLALDFLDLELLKKSIF